MTFRKAIYWYDPTENAEKDFISQVEEPCKKYGIWFKEIEKTDIGPRVLNESFDVLFFDWGGMCIGNNMIYHFCRNILKHAEDNPSKYYVMVSAFTREAMKDAIDAFGEEKPFNVFLSIEEFAGWLKNNKNKS